MQQTPKEKCITFNRGTTTATRDTKVNRETDNWEGGRTATDGKNSPHHRTTLEDQTTRPATPYIPQVNTPESEANLEALVILIKEDTIPSTPQPHRNHHPQPSTSPTNRTLMRECPLSDLYSIQSQWAKTIYEVASTMHQKNEEWRLRLNAHTTTLIGDSNLQMVEPTTSRKTGN
jgi:hypothetical protein